MIQTFFQFRFGRAILLLGTSRKSLSPSWENYSYIFFHFEIPSNFSNLCRDLKKVGCSAFDLESQTVKSQ